MKIYLFIIGCFLGTYLVQAQSYIVPKKGAKDWFLIKSQYELRRYESVIPELEKYIQKYPDFIVARMHLVEAYLYTFHYEKAAQLTLSTIEQWNPKEKEWWAMNAEANKQLKRYPEALHALKSLRNWPHTGIGYQKFLEKEIENLEYTWYMIQHPVPFEPIHLGNVINTSAYELYPFLSPEGHQLFFTRKERNEDLYFAELVDGKWAKVTPLPFNTNDNEGAQSVSADGQMILFTACNHSKGLGSCDIFYSIRHNGKWTTPAGIGAPINSTDWESQPFISTNGMAIIFSSNRHGGFGGRDLYISYLSKDNKWMEPLNLGSNINTSGDEGTPFLHADGKTLYFSSNGHQTVGGKDLYMTQLNEEGKWSDPVNLGYPINTESDEISIYVALDGKSAYLSSDRDGGQGRLDIYQFVLHDSVQADPATFVKAIVKDAQTGQLLDAEYQIFDFSDNSLFARGDTQNDGFFLICMPIENTYRLQIEKTGYVFHSEQFQPQSATMVQPFVLEVALQPIDAGVTMILKNVLFKTDSYQLQESSYPELQKVIQLMEDDARIHAVIKGHTDNVGLANYNLDLSQKRAQAVVDYLVKNGIAPNRLKALGLGQKEPIADNDTEEGRQQNRRTEFVIERK